MLKNTTDRFGLTSIVIHWITAFAIIGLFALGVYMVDLTYYSPWYHRAPQIHESIGLILLAIMLVRVILRLTNPTPAPLETLSSTEKKLAPVAHWLFYVLIFAVLISGYLISSAGEEPISIFEWITVPAYTLNITNQQDMAGIWHERIAWAIIALTVLHTLAALKHHFIDKDTTLLRMLGINRNSD